MVATTLSRLGVVLFLGSAVQAAFDSERRSSEVALSKMLPACTIREEIWLFTSARQVEVFGVSELEDQVTSTSLLPSEAPRRLDASQVKP